MTFMLLVYLDEDALSESEYAKCYMDSAEVARELRESGHYVDASPLLPTSTAKSVRVRDGGRVVTDGPFAETREQLGGYFLIHADDPEEAIDIAERVPIARVGTIEVRQVLEIDGLPES